MLHIVNSTILILYIKQIKTTNLADMVVFICLIRIKFGFKQVHIYSIAPAVYMQVYKYNIK